MNTLHAGDRVPGVLVHAELMMRFTYWFDAQRHTPEIRTICERFNVSRATAYRWRSCARTAKGVATA